MDNSQVCPLEDPHAAAVDASSANAEAPATTTLTVPGHGLVNVEEVMPFEAPAMFKPYTVVDVYVTVQDFVDGATKRAAHRDSDNALKPATYKITRGDRPGTIVDTSEDGLKVRLNLDPEEDFTIEGDDLHTTVTIFDLEGKYGADIKLDTPYGMQDLTVDAATAEGSVATYADLGLPRADGTIGDLVTTWDFEESPTYPISISIRELARGFEKTFTVFDGEEAREIEVSLEAGWRPGDEIEISEEYCNVRLEVRESQHYSLDGDDVTLELTISAFDALHGCTVSVGLPHGSEDLIIDSGTDDGEEIVFDGLGLPEGDDNDEGDLRVTIRIEPARVVTVVRNVVAEEVEEASMWERLIGWFARRL